MQSLVELEIGVEQARLAELFADPQNNTRWMDDLERVEPISGQLGQPGSRYRLVPRRGSLVFMATVVTRNLPGELSLMLEAPTASVSVKARLEKLSGSRTRLVSEETFRFHGVLWKLLGFFSKRAIRSAHRGHMEAFKRFAERQIQEGDSPGIRGGDAG